jgi:2-oxoglutarate ferredoxin oxidoreductase subunit beta
MSTPTQTTPADPNAPKLTRKDFASDQEVRWCPGCGDYSILAQVQKVMPDLGIPREKLVFISGIGCSSRFPYYMNTYGFHSIHGRAMTLATGLKTARPELSVWVVTGDGDGLSIGGNHFLHTLRRNVDLNVILFNNRIYGLTKGQYSPTSVLGQVTKSSPLGTIEHPINPVRVAIAAEATWVGRSVDVDTKHLPEMIRKMADHKGLSFLEVYQNCNIFNDGAFEHFVDKPVRSERMLYLEPGKPMRFGANNEKGIVANGLKLAVVSVGENGAREADLLVYDATDPAMAYLISQMDYPDFPVPVGVFLDFQRETYEDMLLAQVRQAQSKPGSGDLQKLLRGPQTWLVE